MYMEKLLVLLHHGIVHVCVHVDSSSAQSSPYLGLGLQYPLPPQFSLEGSNVGILHSQQITTGSLASLWGHVQL